MSKINAVARAQLTFQMLTYLDKYLYRQRQYSKSWVSKCLALIAQRLEHSARIRRLGVRVPSGRDILLSQKGWLFHKNIRSTVENEWFFPRTVNISNVYATSKYLYYQSKYSKTWDSTCLALITQMARTFGMGPKVGGSSLSRTLSQEHPFVCRKWMPLPAHS